MKKTRIIIIVVVCVALLVGGYAFWTNNNSNASSENVELTKVQQLITKDLSKNYPATPREVVKLYNEIITCFYGEEYTEAELEKLVDMTLMLMDEELAANNPREDYLKRVKMEILAFDAADRTIVSYTLESSNEVEHGEIDGEDSAIVQTSYFIKEKNAQSPYSKTFQNYLLRKDADGNWKILGFEKVEGDTSDGK